MMDYSAEWKMRQLRQGVPLHFPPTATDDQRVVRTHWILRAVEAGMAVDLDNAILPDDLDLQSRNMLKPLILVNCRCRGINLEYATFAQIVRLDGSAFSGQAQLHAAKFERDLTLKRAHFVGTADFSDAIVDLGIYGAEAVFHGPFTSQAFRARHVDFSGAVFEGETRFSVAEIGGQMAVGDGAIFKQVAHFDGMQVAGSFGCQHATFCNVARFNGLRVGGQANFQGSRFEDAIFDNMHVTWGLYFNEASFRGDTKLVGAIVDAQVELFGATFEKAVHFDRMRIATGLFCGGRQRGRANRNDRQPTKFRHDARFVGINVGGQGVFSRASFEGSARFDDAHVAGSLFCESATFAGATNFIGADIEGDAVFAEAIFREQASFDRLRVGGSMFCVGTKFEGAENVRFVGLRVGGDLMCDNATFNGETTFRAATIAVEVDFESGVSPRCGFQSHTRRG